MAPTGAYSEQSDEELAARAARDGHAFAALVHRYERPLYGYLRRMLNDPSDTQDDFQETFLRVYKNIDQYFSLRPFKPWLYAIATNYCTDLQRRRALRRFLPLFHRDNIPRDVPDPARGPAERAEAAETAARLAIALQTLDPAHRAVFLMARYEGLSYVEIAQALKIPLGTVKSRMNTATRALLRLLSENQP